LENEVVLFDLQSGRYYGLEAVGARIWELIQEPKSVAELQQAIAAEYEVDATRCEQDLIAFLQALLERQLIEVSGT
jgi:PqqD family protein of HPr-rel-A system